MRKTNVTGEIDIAMLTVQQAKKKTFTFFSNRNNAIIELSNIDPAGAQLRFPCTFFLCNLAITLACLNSQQCFQQQHFNMEQTLLQ